MTEHTVLPFRRRAGKSPPFPFVLNQGSWQSRELLVWFPFHPLSSTGANKSAPRNLSIHPGNEISAGTGFEVDPYVALDDGWWIFFDGGNDDYDIGSPTADLRDLPTTYDFTVSMWFRPSGAANNDPAICWSGTDDLIIYPHESGGDVRVFWRDLGGSIINVSGAATDNVAQHIAFASYASNDHRLYLDGKEIGTSTGTGTAGPFSTLEIGSFGAQRWKGWLRDIRIYQRALSPSEIWALYAPESRWDLYYQPARRLISIPAVGGAVVKPAGSLSLLGVGV